MNTTMRRLIRVFTIIPPLLAVSAPAADLASGFRNPPPEARPWVYWFPLDGNLSSNGITADLEAMARVGIGGVLYMETDQGAPQGPAAFAGPLWRNLFKHICGEANRLGLEVNMNNDAGWCGSGGPWITPELSMQKVTFSETTRTGPATFAAALPEPPRVANYYRDIAVYAFPALEGGGAKIADIEGKAAFVPKHDIKTAASYPSLPPGRAIERKSLVDLTRKLDAGGRLTWDVPPGKWTVIRFGHTSTGKDNHPAPSTGRGLESDKLSRRATELHFNELMGKLIQDNRALSGEGKTLVSTHIDSWETGSQNWTPTFREDFRRLRGYDLLPFLPVFSGRVIDTMEISERFLWDVRQTVGDLLLENYAGHFRRLAHRHGLRLSIEAYDNNPCDDLSFAGRADEPMAEFWSWSPYGAAYSCTEMSSAAHVYGRRILGAEAFTATDGERWQGHPFAVKEYGDWAFCEGINRFVFHRYALQPWTNPDRPPGMSMGPWGLHYERGQTWWEQSRAWHEYLSRCQFLLRQGLFVADTCYLAPEKSPQRWQPPNVSLERPAYNFDGCPPEVLLTRMKVRNGRLTLPDGMSYRILALPKTETMTPRLLKRIAELVRAGATVVGDPPKKSPSLAGYPRCDEEVKRLAGKLWGADAGDARERWVGKGRVITGKTPAEVLAADGIKPDFVYQAQPANAVLRYIHRQSDGVDIYFVANRDNLPVRAVGAFRAPGKRPEFWRPDTGEITPAAAYETGDGTVRVALDLDPVGSVFVIFRDRQGTGSDRVLTALKDGQKFIDTAITARPALVGNNQSPATNFALAVWVNPDAEIGLPRQTNHSIFLGERRNDALYPAPGHEMGWGDGHAGAGLSVGRNGVCVYEHGADYFAPTLVWPATLTNWTHVTVVYRDSVPELYLDGKLVHTGTNSSRIVHSALGVRHSRGVEAFQGEIGEFTGFNGALNAAQVAALPGTMSREPAPKPERPAILARDAKGAVQLLAFKTGSYELVRPGGAKEKLAVSSVPAPQSIDGPWRVSFDPKWGGPASPVSFDQLTSWSAHADPGIKYYSGTAVYRKSFTCGQEVLGASRCYLDLGRVSVMAEIKLNGRDFGVLWKPPFRIDATGLLKPGANDLEIRVVNLWINRMIGDEQLPEDSDRNPNGTLKVWPEWLEEGKPSPAGRYTFTSWKLWKKNDPLASSGLLGPVRLVPAQFATGTRAK